MIISESEVLDPSESRLTAELAALALDPDLTYRLSHRPKRTLLFIQISPASPQHLHRPPRLRISGHASEELEQRGSTGTQQLVHNAFMFEESKDRLASNAQNEYFLEETGEQEDTGREREQRVIFTFILHHEMYPYEAPYITASLPDHWPRVDDGRNYFDDIMQTDCWWPLLTLAEIIQQLPAFAHQLLRSIRRKEGPTYGQFEADVPLYREDLLEVSPHFFPCRLQLKHGKGLASYHQTWAYLTYSAVAILDEPYANVFYVRTTIPLEDLVCVDGIPEQGGYKMALQNKAGSRYKLKWAAGEIDEQLLSRILLLKLYYQVMAERVQGRPHTLKLIDTCNQIIVEADALRLPHAVRWAKARILEAAAHLQ